MMGFCIGTFSEVFHSGAKFKLQCLFRAHVLGAWCLTDLITFSNMKIFSKMMISKHIFFIKMGEGGLFSPFFDVPVILDLGFT